MRRGVCTKFGAFSAFALAAASFAQPANDLCGSAAVVGLGSTAFDTTGAGTEGPNASCGFGGAPGTTDVFFSFTAPLSTTYRIDTCSGFAPLDDSIVQVFAGGCAGLTEIGCNDDFCGLLSRVDFVATAGTTYIIRVSGFGVTDVGAGVLTVTEPPPAPAGDLCTNATPVSIGSTAFDTTSAANDDTTNCGGSGPDIFYSFMSAGGGCFTIDTFGSGFDTVLAILESDCATEIACNDDSGSLQSMVNFVAAPGVTYIIQVDGFGGSSGAGTLNIAGPNPGPANDLCANAIAVTVGSTAFDNNCAGTEGSASCGFGGDTGTNDIWYTFQAPTTDIYRIDTCQSGGLDTILQVLDLCGGTELACNDDACGLSSSVSFSATSGTTYVIRLAGFAGTQGAGTMTIGVPPGGDTCPTTLVASVGSTAFDTSTFTADDATNCGGSGPDMFFNFTPTTTGCYQIDTIGSGFDTVLAALESDCVTELACNDDSGGTLQSSMTVVMNAGTTYVIQVDGFGGASGAGTLNISPLPAPVNDLCVNATTAVVGANAFTNICAGTEGTDSCGFNGLPGLNDVFFSFTPTTTSNYVIDTCGTFDTTLVVSDTCGGTELACNDDSCGLSSSVNILLNAGTTYRIRVAGWNGAQGSGNMNITAIGANPYEICTGAGAFEDISATGTNAATASNCDDCSENAAIGFSFSFFGGSFSDLFIASNGIITFGVGTGDFSNDPIPSANTPNNFIAPLWDDFNPGVQGDIYYQTLGTAPNRRFIVQWTNCIQFGAVSGSNTFQAVLFEGSNNIEYRYGVIDAQVAGDSSVGVEDTTGNTGVGYDNALLGSGNTGLTVSTSGCGPVCDDIDFNNDGLFPDTLDIEDFISVFQGGPCSTGTCSDLDFNNDGLLPDTTDLEALISVFQGGPCI